MSTVQNPTVIHTFDRTIVLTWFNNQSKIHREEGLPARIILTDMGELVQQEWFEHGHVHNETRPARIYYVDGRAREHNWLLYGKPVRDGEGPTTEIFSKEGDIERQTWTNEAGSLHHVDGPAVIDYIEGYEIYWLNGVEMSRTRWESERQAYLVHKMTREQIEKVLGHRFELIGE